MTHSAPPFDGYRSRIQEARDLLAVIVTALGCHPVDEESLRRGVWNLVSLERSEGTSPGEVILTLTDIVGAARVEPLQEQQLLIRRVIVWCVEAYFGQLGGDVPDAGNPATSPPEAAASPAPQGLTIRRG